MAIYHFVMLRKANALSFSVHEVYNVKNIMIEKGGSDDPL